MGVIETRREQMFPRLTPSQRVTALRFASDAERTFEANELLYDIGERDVPAWLILEGSVDVTRRAGLENEAPITTTSAVSSRARSANWPAGHRWQPVTPAPTAVEPSRSMPRTFAR